MANLVSMWCLEWQLEKKPADVLTGGVWQVSGFPGASGSSVVFKKCGVWPLPQSRANTGCDFHENKADNREDRDRARPARPDRNQLWDTLVSGLYVRVADSGARRWCFRYRNEHGKVRPIKLVIFRR